MAFTVTPTSGNGPYTYAAEISEQEKFDRGFFRLEFAGRSSGGTCPAGPTGGTLVPEAVADLLADGEYIRTTNVASPLCNTAVLRIVRNSDDEIVDYLLASIDNIE